MNLYEEHYSNRRFSDSDGLELAINEPTRRTLEPGGYDDKEIIFGIRSNDIHF